LFEVIVQEAKDAGLAGATVFEGFMGYGANSVVHHASVWRLSQDLPVIIEIIDDNAKVRAFLPRVEALLSGGGLITLEKVTVLHYGLNYDAEAPHD
jgi:PII-like signaling protein